MTLKDNARRFEISMFDEGPAMLGHKVVKVGADYVLLEDVAGVTSIRVPIYSIKSIVKIKVPRK